MAVTITKQQQINGQSWSLTWASDLPIPSPTFYIYQNGILANATQANNSTFRVSAGAQLLVEVLDDPNQKPSFVYSGVVTLGWYQTPETASYRIEQWTGSAWSVIDTLPDIGAWFVSWVSPFLPDCQPYQFRITPIGTNGNTGTPQTLWMVDAVGNGWAVYIEHVQSRQPKRVLNSNLGPGHLLHADWQLRIPGGY